MSTQRSYSQIPPRLKYLRTVVDTTWLYPIADIEAALATTTHEYTFDGTNIVCPDYDNLVGIYLDIIDRTGISQPTGNLGFSLGVGTMLEEMGEEIYLKVGDMTWVHWRNVRQLTPQSLTYLASPGNSPAGTIGYVTVSTSFGRNNPAPNTFDLALVVRLG